MQGSPASPKATLPSLFAEHQDGSRLPLLPLTAQKMRGQTTGFMKTPGTLSKGAHRVPNSALKDTSTKLSFAGAVNHFSLFEKVEHAEKENAELKLQLLACRGDLYEALEKAKEAEAAQATAAAATAFQTSTEPVQEGDASGNDLHSLSKAQLIERLLALQKELASAQQERRQAVNQLVEMKGAIRVYCRVRPPSPGAPSSCLRVLPDGSSLGITCNNQESVFNFNRVFGPSASQQAVYQEVAELVQSALDGYHVCIMSYGQTGSGKTHNMVGNQSADGHGLIPRAINKIMGSMRRLGLQGWDYKLELSCVEVYNNSVRDLLDPKAQHIKDMNAIKHDAQGGHTVIQGVQQVELRTASQAHALLQKAMEARACNATAMNSSSSRSHSAFMLNISGTHAPSETHLKGALCLVDLAG
ncbi:P-loop containing nucleoside triphosphate hydrolase protein, partial [Dunaliella salina]